MLRLDEVGLTSAGTQLVANGVQGVTSTASTMAPALVIPPSGMDSVSIMASAGWGAYGAVMQVIDMFAQQEIVRLGTSFLETVADYNGADAAGAESI
ncbi:PE domain-containing protein [Mycobacteroides abscessus]|uniref:PE domain-containing protein n=1 Tax=Mycobacteroides abscessus TaxID=36809 RepID=UPI002102DAC4|nr:PE domain-containing protein [Mycobacteroides abscessus]